MTTSALPEISSDVEEAFDEMECIFGTKTHPHGGGKVAFFEGHGCSSGFICQSHMDYYISTYRPMVIEKASRLYGGFCVICKFRFYSVDEHHKVYPL